MTIRYILIILLLNFCNDLFSQKIVSRDADNYIWMITDTISHQYVYIDRNGYSSEVVAMKSLKSHVETLDSLIMCNQYDLWINAKHCNEFEPYAAAVYSILFSKKMKIKEIRILRREAYNNSTIDNILKKSIMKSGKSVWKKKRSTNKKNVVFVSRTKIAIPLDMKEAEVNPNQSRSIIGNRFECKQESQFNDSFGNE